MSYVYLQHHGIKGQKWGVRRFQNADGSYTAAGKKRYGDDDVSKAKAAYKSAKKDYNKSYDKAYGYSSRHMISQFAGKKQKAESDKRWNDVADKANTLNTAKAQYKTAKANAKFEKSAKRVQTKQYGQLEDSYIYKKNVKEKDLKKAYGRLEDSIKYSKYGNKKANTFIQKALDELDKQLSQTGKKTSYDSKRVNDLIDKAMMSIEEDLDKN